jgi:hypothetical protein
MKGKSKKSRGQVKNPGLSPHYNSKIRQEYIDYDYIHLLTDEQKSMLNQFTEEYYGASLDYENLENNFHNTQDLKKDCTDRNNARNRCIYGIYKATNRLLPITTYTEIIDPEDED